MGVWGNNFFSQEVLPGAYANWVAKKYIDPRIEVVEKTEEFEYPEDKSKEIVEQLKAEIKEQLDRKKGLEDKIKSILFIISVSITAITFCLKDLNVSREIPLSYLVLVFLGLSILYFVFGAILALKSLVPIGFHGAQEPLKFDSENKKLIFTITEPEIDLKQLMKSKLLNDLINLKVQNKTNAILVLLRNGLILFAAFFLTALLSKKAKTAVVNKIVIPVEIKFDTLSKTKLNVGSHDSVIIPQKSKKVIQSETLNILRQIDSVKNQPHN